MKDQVIKLQGLKYIRKWKYYKCALSVNNGEPWKISQLPWQVYVDRFSEEVGAAEEAEWYAELNRGYAQDRI